MNRSIGWLLALCAALFVAVGAAARDEPRRMHEVAVTELPRPARDTLALIRKGGPFPYKRDGVVFNNFEKRLPLHDRGYYREYTVPTPGAKDRGARRLVAGKEGEIYYTDDHYKSFKRVRE
jgi:ribonuclease T1